MLKVKQLFMAETTMNDTYLQFLIGRHYYIGLSLYLGRFTEIRIYSVFVESNKVSMFHLESIFRVAKCIKR